MDRRSITLATSMLWLAQAFAQVAPLTEWENLYGGSDHELPLGGAVQTADGGYAVAGYADSNDGQVTDQHGGGDIWVIKLDPSGALIWERCIGGSEQDWGRSLDATADGGVVVTGECLSDDDDWTGCLPHAWRKVVKLDADGAIQWTNCFDAGMLSSNLTCIKATSDGGYIVSGGDGDIQVAKLDASGALEWLHTYGGSQFDWDATVVETANGDGYVFAGVTGSNDGDVSGNHGSNDAWVVKLDPAGNIQWQRCLGGSGGDGATSIARMVDGGYLLYGTSSSNDGDVTAPIGPVNAWAVKLNSSGDILWDRSYNPDSSGVHTADGYNMEAVSDGGALCTGKTENSDQVWVMKIDAVGTLLWQGFYGYDGVGAWPRVRPTTDGGAVVTDAASHTFAGVYGHGGGDFWVLKLHAPAMAIGPSAIQESPFSVVYDRLHAQVRIDGPAATSSANVDLISSSGVVLRHQKMNGTRTVMDVSGSAMGIYLVRIGDTKEAIVKRLVIDQP